jgi:hypothetical protein
MLTGITKKIQRISGKTSDFDIIEFVTKPQGLGYKLFPSQRFFLKVFEKLPLDNRIKDIDVRDKFNDKVIGTFTEVGFYQYLIDNGKISLDYQTYCANPIINFELSMGRRASKTTMIVAYIAFKTHQILNIYCPQEYFGILKDDSINITMAALGQDNADKLFKRYVSVIRNSTFFKPFIKFDPNSNTLRLWTKYDLDQIGNRKPDIHSNSINVMSVPNTPSVRGDNNVFVVLDEFAHFNQPNKSTRDRPLDEAISQALTPSVSGFKTPEGEPFGKILILSSPNGKKGKFFKEYEAAFKLKKNSYTLAIQAATWEVNPMISTAYLRKQYNTDPSGYAQEYGAEFIEGGVNWLRDLASLYSAFDTRLDAYRKVGKIDRTYFLGVDFALSNDGTACSVVHFEPNYEEPRDSFIPEAFSYDDLLDKRILETPSGKFIVDYCEGRYAGEPPYEHMKVLDIDEILVWIEDLYLHWPIRYGMYDQWSGAILEQMIKAKQIRRLQCVKHTQAINDSQYKLFSNELHGNRLKLPYDKLLENELLKLRIERRSNGIIKVEAPPGGQYHDDRFDSLIRALYLCYIYVKKDLSLAGQILQGVFNRDQIVKRTMSFNAVAGNERLFKKVQSKLHKTQDLRNPKSFLTNRMSR